MSAPRLSEQEKLAILEAYQTDESVRSIAQRFGVDQAYPTILARRRGIACKQPNHWRKVRDA